MGIVVTTLKPAIVAKHNVSVGLFSCNLLVVISLDRLLAGFEAREGLVTKREKVSQLFVSMVKMRFTPNFKSTYP